MKLLEGKSITFVMGIKALGKNIGIKNSKKDFCVVFSEKPANAAAVFTTNTAKAAPVILGIEKLKKQKTLQALSVISGIANAGTAEKGRENARLHAKLVAEELGIKEELVFISSTGIIGKQLPMGKIKAGVKGVMKELSSSHVAGIDASAAILTTDREPKTVAVEFEGIRMAGMVKGGGMICPHMATMLCFLFTDADLDAPELQAALNEAVEKSFNSISVDGCQSTNDTVLLLANGMSGKKPSVKAFQEALDLTCILLAKKLLLGAEGATKIFSVRVEGAKSAADARRFALSVVKSNLFKAAVHGNDLNWGRVLQAIGQAQLPFREEDVSIIFGSTPLVEKGVEAEFDFAKARAEIMKKEFEVTIVVGSGAFGATAYGCDLSEEYVRINASYST